MRRICRPRSAGVRALILALAFVGACRTRDSAIRDTTNAAAATGGAPSMAPPPVNGASAGAPGVVVAQPVQWSLGMLDSVLHGTSLTPIERLPSPATTRAGTPTARYRAGQTTFTATVFGDPIAASRARAAGGPGAFTSSNLLVIPDSGSAGALRGIFESVEAASAVRP